VDELTRLLLDARDGDRWALRAFIQATQGEVWGLMAHQVGRTEADDLTQDVYVRVWRALPRFRGDASARTWLLAIARRVGFDELRRRARRRRLTERLSGLRTPSTQPDAASQQGSDGVITALKANLREAFVLTQLLGFSYQETADICGVPIGTVRSRVARAREELLAVLRDAQAS
jgi:RNA polymerase sigma-70 factor, ECF subfamily